MNSNLIVELVKKNYTPVFSVNSGKTKKCKVIKKSVPAVHRVPTKWGYSLGLDLIGVIKNNTETIVLDDPVCALQSSVISKHQGYKNNVTLITSDESNLNFSNIVPTIIQMNDEDDFSTIMRYTPMNKDFTVVGNNAFSITYPVLKHICSVAPLHVRLVTESWVFNGMPDGKGADAKRAQYLLTELKSIGLRKVFYLKNMLFEQYSPDGVSKDKAQVSALVFHTERDYRDRVEVYGPNDNLIYTADRSVAKFLPKSKLSYEAGHMNKVDKAWVGYSAWSHALDQLGYKKADLTPQILSSKQVQDLQFSGQYRIQINHMNNGTPGNNTFWTEHNVGFQLCTAKAIDPSDVPEYQTIIINYDQDKLKRDSHISLIQTKEFWEIYQASATAKGLQRPVIEHFLERFPADRTWTSQEVLNYVAKNKRD
jgi:hypothetical protein